MFDAPGELAPAAEISSDRFRVRTRLGADLLGKIPSETFARMRCKNLVDGAGMDIFQSHSGDVGRGPEVQECHFGAFLTRTADVHVHPDCLRDNRGTIFGPAVVDEP